MLAFQKKLIQAPLAGYSCAPLRRLAHEWGRPDFCCSEMLSAKHIASGAQQRKRYYFKDEREGPLCIQLAANDVSILAEALETVKTWSPDLVDLNCGCPQPKIRKKRYGSQLLAESKKLGELVAVMKSKLNVPVLVKIRVDNASGDDYNLSVAHAVEDAGADALTVHGRHWTERYDVPVSYRDIAQIKQAVSIPVIGNGDVKDVATAKRMFDETGCDAVMIGRASVGQPWLFAQIDAELNGKPYQLPTVVEIGRIFLEHVAGLIELEGEKIALLQSRSLLKYYARGCVNADGVKVAQAAGSYAELERNINELFQNN